jgi:hypothetical protein
MPRIALGFQRPVQNPREWLDSLDDDLWTGNNNECTAAVHGFAMTSYVDQYPFESVDSTTWISELRALKSVRAPHCCLGQAATVIRHTPDSELVAMVIKSWERRFRGNTMSEEDYAISSNAQGDLFKGGSSRDDD